MFANPESEVASLREVLLPQFVFLDFEPALEDLFGFGAAHGDVDGDLLVTSDTECSDGVAGFACRGGQERLKSARIEGGEAAQEGIREKGKAYCRRAFDQIIVRALWRHG